jgi:hypothetical protein
MLFVVRLRSVRNVRVSVSLFLLPCYFWLISPAKPQPANIKRLKCLQEIPESQKLILFRFRTETSIEQSPSCEANGYSVKIFVTFYETRRFITMFTRPRHCFLSWVIWIQSTCPHPIYLISILLLSPHLYLDLRSNLLPSSCIPTKALYQFPISPLCVTCFAHLVFFNLITLNNIWRRAQIVKGWNNRRLEKIA